jgi:DNA-binding Xre family transcriptional regulator
MWMKRSNSKEALLAEYERGMLRSAFVSLFWSIIAYRKAHGRFALKMLADRIGIHKSASTRWFSGERPNWTVNTIADIANALEVEIEITATDRKTGVRFASYGIIEAARMSSVRTGDESSTVTTDNSPRTSAQPVIELIRERDKRAVLSIAA